MTIDTQLIDDIKNYLNVSWDEDVRLSILISSGMAYLNAKRGAPADYSADGTPRTLLFEYVRYARDNALEVFENNFLHLILLMQSEKRADNVEEDENTDAEEN